MGRASGVVVFDTEGKEAMVFQGNRWGWRTMTVRLFLAPVLAAGLAGSAGAQALPAAAAKPQAARAMPTDPKELLKMGREALKAGQFDKAQDLARQADAKNPTGRWGFLDDTPESLEKDIRAARAKADKGQAEQMTKQAKETYAKAMGQKLPVEKLILLDQAYALADRAVTLQGPTDFFDDVLGSSDRPEKLKKEIDVARIHLKRTTPASEFARKPVPPKPTNPVMPVGNTGKPMDPAKVATAGLTVPVPSTVTVPSTFPIAPASPVIPAAPLTATAQVLPATPVVSAKAQAMMLVADGRTLLKQNKLTEAKAKASDAQKLGATYAATEDTPDALLKDVLADGKSQMDMLARSAESLSAKKEFVRAEAALTIASQIGNGLGLPTKAIDIQIGAVRTAKKETALAVANPTPGPLVVPGFPVAPMAPTVATVPTIPGPIVPTIKDPTVPAPLIPPLATPAPTVATVPVIPPLAPPLTVPSPTNNGSKLLADAAGELRRGEMETARKMAVLAMNGGDAAVKAEAEKLLRDIDTETYNRKRKDAVGSFIAAAEYYNAKQYEQALGVAKLIDPAMLAPDQATQLAKLTTDAIEGLKKIKSGVATTAGQEPKIPAGPLTPSTPTVPPAASGLSDQVKALAEVEFQKLRTEGLEAQTKAQEAFNGGATDLAIQLLADYTAKVHASTLSPARQGMLLTHVDRRLDGFRIMKRQMDFLTAEATGKRNAKDMVAGRNLADAQKKDEIGKKVREINELVKAHKYRDAESLALQVKTLDPDDATLSAVYEMAKRQRRLEEYKLIKDQKEVMFLDRMNDAERVGPIPENGVMSVDVQRQLNSMRRGTGADIYVKSMTEKEREIELRLDKPLTIVFEKATMRDVLDTLRRETKLNITVDEPSLDDEKINLETVIVSDKLTDLSLRNVLAITLDKARLKFVIEHDAIRITTEKKAKGKLYTKVFSVMDLVTPVPDFALADHQSFAKGAAKASNPMPNWSQPGPNGASVYQPAGALQGGQMVGQNAAPWAGPAQGPGVPSAGLGTLDNRTNPLASSMTLAANPRSNASFQLMSLITKMVRPYSWQDMGGAGALQYYDIGGALVVNQTADVIKEVQDLLESLRRLQETSVSVEIRVISLSEAFFERIGVDFSMNIKTKGTNNFERSLTTGQFRPEPFINDINARGVTVGYNPAGGGFTPDLDVPIRATSYALSSPPFGGYQQNLSPALNGGLSVGLAFLNDIQVYLFMEAAQGDRRVNIMQAPKITLFNGQTSTVFVSDVAFFTLGLQVINVGGQFVYLPQNTPIPIGTASGQGLGIQGGQPGVSVTVQAIVSADRRFVRMNMSPTLSALTSATVPLFPVTAFITPVFEGGSQGVPIPFTQFFQQPSISEITVQTTVAVPDGGTVVLGGLKTLAEGRNEFGPPVLSSIPYLNRLFRNQGIGRETRHIMIMVTPRIIINSEEEFNQTGQGAGQLPTAGAP